MTDVSVIIVNYNAADLAIKAVESVLSRDHDGLSVDIHLLDNASPMGDAERLQAKAQQPGWRERVVLYCEKTNHGFGRGNNLVFRALAARDHPPDKVFLLNPDAQLENEAIAILASFLDDHPRAGCAGARIEKPGKIPVTAAFRFPSAVSEFSSALSFGPVTRLCARWQVPLGHDLPTQQVDWVAGAAVMFRFDALCDVGFFDPAYFLYYEEVDLMRDMASKGWQTWYVTDAEIIHVEGAATGVKSDDETRKRRPAYWYESWVIYFRKNHGRLYALLAGIGWMIGAVLHILLARIRGRTPETSKHLFQDFWAMAGRPLVGLEARPYD